MNGTQALVISLLKSAVTAEPQTLPSVYDLQAAFQLALRHHIGALIYDGALYSGLDTQLPEMAQLFQYSCRAIQQDRRQMDMYRKICHAFDLAQIDFMPLKGCRMKELYPKSEMRTMSDMDILIRTEQYEQIVPVMESLGFSWQGESDHELKWRAPGLYVELHKHLMPSGNRDYYAYYGTGWQLAELQGGHYYAMAPEDEFVFLFAHFAKHFRDGGAGCRYMVDLWVYLEKNPHLNQSKVETEMEKLGLLTFYRHICGLLKAWFADGEWNETQEIIHDFIMAGGTWGTGASNEISQSVRDSRHGRWSYMKKLFFPSAHTLRFEYPFLAKKPWLLPGCWIVRGFRKVFLERGTVKRKAKIVRAMETDAIRQREEFLHKVGLDYNF